MNFFGEVLWPSTNPENNLHWRVAENHLLFPRTGDYFMNELDQAPGSSLQANFSDSQVVDNTVMYGSRGSPHALSTLRMYRADARVAPDSAWLTIV